jgi:hypothetical protein
MPVVLKTAVVAASLICNPAAPPVATPGVASVISAPAYVPKKNVVTTKFNHEDYVVSAPVRVPITSAEKKIVIASKLSYEEELMKKYYELKELENYWKR